MVTKSPVVHNMELLLVARGNKQLGKNCIIDQNNSRLKTGKRSKEGDEVEEAEEAV